MPDRVGPFVSSASVAGRVVSVNVGRPSDVPWQGRTVRTAIWKIPVAGRVRVSRLNLEGDGQADLANHGGEQRAILVYQMESYRFWSHELGRSDLMPGHFGENLTVEGLADSDVCIGDRYRIGTVTVEVTQPRVTCYRLGIRLGVPAMPALLVKHKRPGFYLRVIEEGDIGAGDTIERVATGPEAVSVAEIDWLLYGPEHPLAALQRASRVPALSRGWRRSIASLLDAGREAPPAGNAGLVHPSRPPHWAGFRPLRVVETRQESDDVRSFTFGSPDGRALPDGLPGQHILLRLAGTDGIAAIRNYSLCGPPGDGFYRIGVKQEGPVSGRLHAEVREGTTLDVGAPRGDFVLEAGETPIVLISAGIGITPMLSMLLAATAPGGNPRREIWWIHAARDGAHDPFRKEQAEALRQLSPGQVLTVFSRPRPGQDRLQADYSHAGHVDDALLKSLGLPSAADHYICGPLPFMRSVEDALRSLSVPQRRIRQEIFGPSTQASGRSPHAPDGPVGAGHAVSFARSGLTVHWSDRFRNLLELAEACDVPVGWSCRSGVCHSCESGLLEGQGSYDPDPIDPPPADRILLCCARPKGPMVIDL